MHRSLKFGFKPPARRVGIVVSEDRPVLRCAGMAMEEAMEEAL